MIEVKPFGTAPEVKNFSTKEQLLIAAWVYGLKFGEPIHRFALFGFVQSHLSAQSEENLQGSLEKDKDHWRSEKRGVYSLTHQGELALLKYSKSPLLKKNCIICF